MTKSNLAECRWRRAMGAALGLMSLVPACNGRAPREPVDPMDVVHDLGDAVAPFEPALTPEGYAALIAHGDIYSRDGDIVVLCEGVPIIDGHDELEVPPTCSVHRIATDGSLVPLGIDGVRSAQRLDRNRLLVETWDGALDVIYEDGRRATLAYGVAGPRVDGTGHRVVYMGPQIGTRASREPGERLRLLRSDVNTGATELIADDAMAGNPLPVPGTDEVLYVSFASGAPAFWTSRAGESPRQLSNVGVVPGDLDFTPVPMMSRSVWADERTLVFVSNYDEARDEVWALDVRSGVVSLLGPGDLPMLTPSGEVIAGGGHGNDGASPTIVLGSRDEGGA